MERALATLAEVAFFAVIDGMTFVGEMVIGIFACGRRTRNE